MVPYVSLPIFVLFRRYSKYFYCSFIYFSIVSYPLYLVIYGDFIENPDVALIFQRTREIEGQMIRLALGKSRVRKRKSLSIVEKL